MSLHADELLQQQQIHTDDSTNTSPRPLPFSLHPHWELGTTWKSALNNLRLLLQPYWCWGWLEAWLQVFPIPRLERAIHQLMESDFFRGRSGRQWGKMAQCLILPNLLFIN
nr:hypothetical protein [Chroococcidiopsis cubana]